VSQWLNLLIETGFRLERIEEPRPSDEIVRARPEVQDAQVVACFLHIGARKLLRATLQMRARLRVLFAGRISGVEG
jgi:folate-dependent tRNA-U54 methylase TrmFO/GidA